MLFQQRLFALHDVFVRDTAFNRADVCTARRRREADALGAQVRVNDINFLPCRNGLIRAFQQAGVTACALGRYLQRHDKAPSAMKKGQGILAEFTYPGVACQPAAAPHFCRPIS